MAKTKRSAKPAKKPPRKPARPRARPAPAPVEDPEPESTLPAVRTATPERAFAARVRPPAPSPPPPASRRAIFVDVENSSRADHVSRVLDHLAIDRQERRVDLIAVGNWRVIGADSARLLARRGAHLVHSAPSTGVKDWSDLRIAVSAGVWLGSARPGDLIEIISDDRAFDAVGDVAALLGVEYRRLSYRGLTGLTSTAEPTEPEAPAPREGHGRRGRRGRRRGRGGGGRPEHHGGRAPAPPRAPVHHAPAPAHEPARAPADTAAHTAPLDELVEIVRELAERAPNGAVLIDTLARTLKERGFSRPPGSPRLITRLRRIHELEVSRTGMITLAGASPAPGGARSAEGPEPEGEGDDGAAAEAETDGGPEPGNEADAEAGAPPAGGASSRPRRRGRRRRRRRGGGGGGTPPPASPA